MLILGIESSAKSASAALCRDGELLAQYFQNSGMTHSQTLLPMVEQMLAHAGLDIAAVDAVAVANGPGSFTGVRIGVATAKGLCWGAEKPAIGVSTLEAMASAAAGCAPKECVLCCAMDARRGQVYNALFSSESGSLTRLCPDRAISVGQLASELRDIGKRPWVLGDGAVLCFEELRREGMDAALAPVPVREQSAWGVCLAAMGKETHSAAELLPVYLRLSQAERERQARLRGGA